MPTFDELALQGNCPVIHTQRRDEATLIATRIPLDDVRLERWGWILTLSHKDGRTDQDDLETLRDNAGRRYPKIYLPTDMKNYIEKWACTEWEEGYHTNGHQAVLARGITSPSVDIVREDVLLQIFSELQERQTQQLGLLKDKVTEVVEVQSLLNSRGHENVQ